MAEYKLQAEQLPRYDTIVCGGGMAGTAAAITAARNGAKTLLVESGGDLGGDITKGLVFQILDPSGKGGLVKDIYAYLNEGSHTAARRGARYDKNGARIHGTIIDLEYLKYYLVKLCLEAGVEILYHSIITACETDERRIISVLIATEAGAFRAEAHSYIDASGNGQLAAMAGCGYECGHPTTGEPQPTGGGLYVTGVPEDIMKTDTGAQKEAFQAELRELGIETSGDGACVVQTAVDGIFGFSFNSQFRVMPESPFDLSRATNEAKIECFEVLEKLRAHQRYRNLTAVATSSHLGVREGRRIFGRYRLTYEDIVGGARFEDAVCLVRFGIDVHRISPDDRRNHSGGERVKPYNIPFRALIPLDCVNLLLAGRCISGDFYAHASYRVAGNVIPTGEAAGYASALAVRSGRLPCETDGKEVNAFMRGLGYEM